MTYMPTKPVTTDEILGNFLKPYNLKYSKLDPRLKKLLIATEKKGILKNFNFCLLLHDQLNKLSRNKSFLYSYNGKDNTR